MTYIEKREKHNNNNNNNNNNNYNFTAPEKSVYFSTRFLNAQLRLMFCFVFPTIIFAT